MVLKASQPKAFAIPHSHQSMPPTATALWAAFKRLLCCWNSGRNQAPSRKYAEHKAKHNTWRAWSCKTLFPKKSSLLQEGSQCQWGEQRLKRWAGPGRPTTCGLGLGEKLDCTATGLLLLSGLPLPHPKPRRKPSFQQKTSFQGELSLHKLNIVNNKKPHFFFRCFYKGLRFIYNFAPYFLEFQLSCFFNNHQYLWKLWPSSCQQHIKCLGSRLFTLGSFLETLVALPSPQFTPIFCR